jgi:hypothetical protein
MDPSTLKKGTRITLAKPLDDAYTELRVGDKGTVVDGYNEKLARNVGLVCSVKWDNGSNLSMLEQDLVCIALVDDI